ncbi:DUF1294 domain-containing protein [Paenibacillus daejeonensis]|uniref:DUF1294 domain-containing protein n=1 Tax=Paenibacillus daejeonensis TaxID=135193 RepID=UPI0003A39CA0|nr:DUF1294 domain-containing protein [Paenibacillus daejeonensis]
MMTEVLEVVPLPALLLVWVLLFSLVGLAVMRYDKRQAGRPGKRRIPEKRLFLLAFAGGASGIWWAMYTYRHKTKHPSFRIGIPILTIVHASVILFVLIRFLPDIS